MIKTDLSPLSTSPLPLTSRQVAVFLQEPMTNVAILITQAATQNIKILGHKKGTSSALQ